MALPDANLGYSYDTLPGPKSIRLLTLHPAEHITDSIKCSIEIVNLLAEKDKYDALSYSWGMDSDGSGDAFLLTLDDKAFSITQNLWDGLKRIRRCKEPVRIWIDAVCINQNDDAEKSVQVVMMADIYAGAKTVRVWLGEGDEAAEDKLFLEVLKQMEERAVKVRPWKLHGRHHQHCFVLPLLGKGASRCSGCVAEQDGAITEDSAHIIWLSKWFVSDPTEGHNAAKMSNLGIKFFSRRYWKRRWILQELAFAKKQLLYWGGCVMDVSDFPVAWLEDFSQAVYKIMFGLRRALRVLDTPGSVHSVFDVYPIMIGDPTILRLEGLSQFCTPQTNGSKKTPTWFSCLQKFHSSECSDARDTYYALASMIEPRIRVDYTLTQAEVFVNFAKMMLGLGEWVWVFNCAAKRATDADQIERWNTDTLVALPTWVPDPRLEGSEREGSGPPMGIQILGGNVLLCDVRCLGVVQKHNRRSQLQWNRLFWQICSSHTVLAANQSIEEILRRPMQLAPLQLVWAYDKLMGLERRSGDIVCSCQEEYISSDVWLILRPSQLASQTYTLVEVTNLWRHYSLNTAEQAQAARDFSTCPKIKVRII
jgi:hypothetical protein